MMHGTMWHDMNGWMGGGSWLGMTLTMLIWAALIAVIVIAVLRLTGGSGRGRSDAEEGNRAESLLRQRFARGEIDEEQFRQMQDVLGSAPR